MRCGVVHKGLAGAMTDAGGGRPSAIVGGAASGGADLEESLQRMLDPAALLGDDDCLERLVHTFVAQDKVRKFSVWIPMAENLDTLLTNIIPG